MPLYEGNWSNKTKEYWIKNNEKKKSKADEKKRKKKRRKVTPGGRKQRRVEMRKHKHKRNGVEKWEEFESSVRDKMDLE